MKKVLLWKEQVRRPQAYIEENEIVFFIPKWMKLKWENGICNLMWNFTFNLAKANINTSGYGCCILCKECKILIPAVVQIASNWWTNTSVHVTSYYTDTECIMCTKCKNIWGVGTIFCQTVQWDAGVLYRTRWIKSKSSSYTAEHGILSNASHALFVYSHWKSAKSILGPYNVCCHVFSTRLF